MNFIQKAKEAIMKVEHTGNLVVEKLEYDIDPNGIRNAKATVLFGKILNERRDYTMEWDREKEEFANVNPKTDLYMSFKRAYNDFKMSQMTERELFDLLRKANRRRKSAERKVRILRDKVRYINRDAMRSIDNRHRVIEEQWEMMRELQRRGLVSSEDMEKVIYDVSRIKKKL
jgi:hypothetical protein